ncbi:hypothetical protein [Ancylobacter sp. FA202]|uniref:hypothetical protein n=1 Tax=Ancylobacter sp. FA202 TaxID=1111106 RepID=UPI000367D0FC|nr:hypothetical protein [Ancylobacter sp. FA202]
MALENPFIRIASEVVEQGAPPDLVATHLTVAGVSLWFTIYGAEGAAVMLDNLAQRLRSDPAAGIEEMFGKSTAPTQ